MRTWLAVTCIWAMVGCGAGGIATAKLDAASKAGEALENSAQDAAADASDTVEQTQADLQTVGIPNAKVPLPGVVTGGAPTEANLAEAKALGYHTVISLLPVTEPEQTVVAEAGMAFVSIPVDTAADLTEENARKLGEVLADEAKRPLILHCASGNRAGALLALQAFYTEQRAPEDALALGVAAGLTSLRPEVESRLGLPASE